EPHLPLTVAPDLGVEVGNVDVDVVGIVADPVLSPALEREVDLREALFGGDVERGPEAAVRLAGGLHLVRGLIVPHCLLHRLSVVPRGLRLVERRIVALYGEAASEGGHGVAAGAAGEVACGHLRPAT